MKEAYRLILESAGDGIYGLDPNGLTIGRCEMILGLLYQGRKKRALALPHLIEAKRIVSQFGPTPMSTASGGSSSPTRSRCR